MKVIDLLNKIANGEEVPNKIRYKTFELERTQSEEVKRLYVDEQGIFFPEYYSFDLNDEVEVIEEDKKIEKIELDPLELCKNTNDNIINVHYETLIVMNKVNELIDTINEMRDNK